MSGVFARQRAAPAAGARWASRSAPVSCTTVERHTTQVVSVTGLATIRMVKPPDPSPSPLEGTLVRVAA